MPRPAAARLQGRALDRRFARAWLGRSRAARLVDFFAHDGGTENGQTEEVAERLEDRECPRLHHHELAGPGQLAAARSDREAEPAPRCPAPAAERACPLCAGTDFFHSRARPGIARCRACGTEQRRIDDAPRSRFPAVAAPADHARRP